ncbi:hypothetical protein EV421DRAFT_1906429 [Armillaria borealis]|uniref:Uncharacterized protein n=1 Tax=Armillaria borealis TaxID=47425 RepID=A0AA39MM56_9AGAR|nr:hypothetical protein EV421DRAFT_1906429 [Armillaria borealis]
MVKTYLKRSPPPVLSIQTTDGYTESFKSFPPPLLLIVILSTCRNVLAQIWYEVVDHGVGKRKTRVHQTDWSEVEERVLERRQSLKMWPEIADPSSSSLLFPYTSNPSLLIIQRVFGTSPIIVRLVVDFAEVDGFGLVAAIDFFQFFVDFVFHFDPEQHHRPAISSNLRPRYYGKGNAKRWSRLHSTKFSSMYEIIGHITEIMFQMYGDHSFISLP